MLRMQFLPLTFLALSISPLVACIPSSAEELGRPFSRTYSFEEIGNLSPGAMLSVDPNGLLWVNQQGALFLFDNQTWIDMIDPSDPVRNVNYATPSPEGDVYYGASGNWGKFELQPNGTFRSLSFRDENAPLWTQNMRFDHIVFCDYGIAFSGQNGLVFRDVNEVNHYYENHRLILTFELDGVIFTSSFSTGIQRLNPETLALESIPPGSSG